ncbi:MAG: ABC transporter permease [Actinobacteria bacterium]|nr:ABC transporter permease [Actinomycetota bacterium]
MGNTPGRRGAAAFWASLAQISIRYGGVFLLGFGLFGLILLISGSNPIDSYRDIFVSTLGSRYGLSEVLVAMTPLLLTALAVALPSRIGLINVGGEGQMYMGACLATWAALTFGGLPGWFLLPIMVLLGMIGGAAWAAVPGVLRARGIVSETISTLLLNPVAPMIVAFFVFGYWHSPMDTNKTPIFSASARLPTLFGTRISLGLILGLALLAVFWFVMRSTRWGLEMRGLGWNHQAGRLNGIPNRKYVIVVMCLGGAIAGLAGMVLVSGYYGVLLANFSRGIGFMGFLVSWLANGSPIGIVVTSFVVAIILTGGNLLQLTRDLPYSVINILLAMTLFVVLARPSFTRKKAES